MEISILNVMSELTVSFKRTFWHLVWMNKKSYFRICRPHYSIPGLYTSLVSVKMTKYTEIQDDFDCSVLQIVVLKITQILRTYICVGFTIFMKFMNNCLYKHPLPGWHCFCFMTSNSSFKYYGSDGAEGAFILSFSENFDWFLSLILLYFLRRLIWRRFSCSLRTLRKQRLRVQGSFFPFLTYPPFFGGS